jgi:structural maintenance of chromosome 2
VGKVKASREKVVKEGEAAEKDMKEVEAKRDAEMKKGGKFKKREKEVAELEKVLVKIRTQVEIKNGSVVDEERKAKGLETELKEVI